METRFEVEGRPLSVSGSENKWYWCGRSIPRSEIVFFCQIIILYTVIGTAIFNISSGDDNVLWITLLSSCLGYLLPSPKLPKSNQK